MTGMFFQANQRPVKSDKNVFYTFSIKDRMPTNPSESEVAKFTAEFERCAIKVIICMNKSYRNSMFYCSALIRR